MNVSTTTVHKIKWDHSLYIHINKLLYVATITTLHNSFLYTEVLGRKMAINEY